MRLKFGIAALLLLLPTLALCESPVLSSLEVYSGCRNFVLNSDTELFHQGLCAGMIDDLAYYRSMLAKDMRYCPPKGVTVGQVAQLVIDYMDAHPEILQKDFRGVAADALRAFWPCPAP
jgi:hypothetical protein